MKNIIFFGKVALLPTQQPLHPGGKDYPGKRKAGGTEGSTDNPTSNQILPE
jgi:hypothetical protein